MLSYKVKRFYYFLFTPIMEVNALIYKAFRSPAKDNEALVKVHLGPGRNNYLSGWINVDSNKFTAKVDLWANISEKLPFRDQSVDVFYSHHVIEHLPSLPLHFEEMFRSLKRGGKIRMGGPNGDSAIAKFSQNDLEWFPDFPDNKLSIGGRFENFIFCRKEHLTILTKSYLEEILHSVGFVNIRVCIPTKTTHFSPFIDHSVLEKEWETDFDFPHTLIIEAEKI